MENKKYKVKVGKEDLIFEINDWAKYADISLLASYGETKVFITLVYGKEKSKLNYLPLKVDYQERYYAAGEILGSKYNKREGKPGTEAILTARVIDRSIRPYFDKKIRNDIHLTVTVLSLGDYDPDFIAINGASLALTISEIPWNGPISSVRISGDKKGFNKINPTYDFRKNEENYFNAVFSGPKNQISMIEMDAEEIKNEVFLEISQKVIEEKDKILNLIEKIKSEIGKEKIILEEANEENREKEEILNNLFKDNFEEKILENFQELGKNKLLDFYRKDFIKKAENDFNLNEEFCSDFFENKIKKIIRTETSKGKRIDGRNWNELREIKISADRISNKIHGSGIFYRGDTHILSILTIGDLSDALFLDGMEVKEVKNYIHHYNFPPYSVGETGKIGSPNRREIGHGNLAEKAIKRMLPEKKDFPYTLRVVTEVLSSQGSTSMAATCGSTLALLSGGVPLKKHVAGVAIGLIQENGENILLTDILGYEDFYGDMDFKITGTEDGITAIQLDLKIQGLDIDLIEKIIQESEKTRKKIILKMKEIIKEPAEMSSEIERVEKIEINKNKIGLLIGKGGENINKITQKSNTKIDIKNNGDVFIYGKGNDIKIALEEIKKSLNFN